MSGAKQNNTRVVHFAANHLCAGGAEIGNSQDNQHCVAGGTRIRFFIFVHAKRAVVMSKITLLSFLPAHSHENRCALC